jgi:hypothetical protein
MERFSYLHIAEVQVLGSPGTITRVGKVTHVACGNQVTAVTMAALPQASYVALVVPMCCCERLVAVAVLSCY